MKLLITGATGNVGSGAAEALRAQHEILLSDIAAMDKTLPFYPADVREPGALDQAAEDVDVYGRYHIVRNDAFIEADKLAYAASPATRGNGCTPVRRCSLKPII
ncbi:NAD(P)-dependent oxidoreductase [Paenibacillus sacheonensis]|uniref:Uncharacterized protein n=1 Tax=Paenibacillus sacheonensis TaxID=742054 RepID=A0A7X4YNQ4_9BACL|nr:NAD(P)-dependent oxidoreductase [Paenibacillus sacheonensis]MBM7565868.1 nucleoside-diphosphate-sugar epimerase [Paenibacillus sacheonensis]NBC68814.1 hypothetical protein [Paenibacillus sacheonensis]